MNDGMLESLLQRWRLLAPGERRGVAIAGLVVALAMVYALLFEPAWRGSRELERELPVLRGQLAQMKALAAEARRLGATPKSTDTPQAMRAALESSVQAAGLGASLAQFKQSGELFDLRFNAVPNAAWLVWLDTTLRETQMRVVDLSATREATPGVVSVRLVLEFPRREGR